MRKKDVTKLGEASQNLLHAFRIIDSLSPPKKQTPLKRMLCKHAKAGALKLIDQELKFRASILDRGNTPMKLHEETQAIINALEELRYKLCQIDEDA